MRKIVVLTGHSEGEERVTAYLKILFPKCRVEHVFVGAEYLRKTPQGSSMMQIQDGACSIEPKT